MSGKDYRMSTKTKLIMLLIGLVVAIVAFFLYPKEFLFGVLGLLVVFLFVVGSSRKRRSYRNHDYYENDEDWGTDSRDIHVYHHGTRARRRIRCPECGGAGKVRRHLMPIQRGAPGISNTKTCSLCRGRRWVWDQE